MRRRTAFWWFFVSAWTVSVAAAGTRAQNDGKTIELPEGDGKAILQRACTTCHGLDEVVKFREYYTKDDWRDVVGTMVKYGAELKDGEPDVLVDYLGKYFSKTARGPADAFAAGAAPAPKEAGPHD